MDEISSIEEYIHFLELDHPQKDDLIFFRGQREDWELLPGIAREIMSANDLETKEKKMLNEIKRWICHPDFFSQNFSTECELELLVYAQHYGMKTRLLDWTPNPLAALFFALQRCQENEYKNPPVVYMLKPHEHRTRYCHTQDDIKNREDWVKMRETIVYIPNYNNTRIMAQDGVFTFHAFSDFGFVPLNKMDSTTCPGKLKLATIKKDKHTVNKLFSHLNILGINQHTIYPDFQNLCKHVNWKLGNE